jgi:phenylpropionate dioxygenase-like ring-hydroxylating dioxygenase large terminal subunit
VEVPGLLRPGGDDARRAGVHAVDEREGIVWVWGEANVAPSGAPRSLAPPGPGYSEVRRVVDFPGSLWATAENALDVPHTAFLHRGLFRGAGQRNDIDAVVTRDEWSATAQYHGEPRPGGLAARILAPGGGNVEHYDRFELPGVAIVDYRLGEDLHFRVLTLLTPLEDFRTRATAVIQFRLRLPHWLVKVVLGPVAMRIFRQDAEILALQTATVARFGGERYISTEIDILGAQIRRLIERAASEAEPKPSRDWERRIKLRV